MKIEKISENQIKFTLTSAELSSRNIKLNELSYGSDKARSLFFDMMQKAHHEFGFDFSNAPLMVEAIPSSEGLTLIITKVTNADELDARFSRFSSTPPAGTTEHIPTGADSLLNMFSKDDDNTASVNITIESTSKADNSSKPFSFKDIFSEFKKNLEELKREHDNAKVTSNENPKELHLVQAYRFNDIDTAIKASKAIDVEDDCKNALYKLDDHSYMLILHSSSSAPEAFNRVCNMLVEYGTPEQITDVTEYYLLEHNCAIIPEKALQSLKTV